jgi:hypothetical protein
LNAALFASQVRLTALPHRFNAQIKLEVEAALLDATIWHYYSSCSFSDDTLFAFEVLARRVINGAKIDKQVIKAMVKRRHPWRRDDRLDDWVARRAVKRGRQVLWESTWLKGNRTRALKELVDAIVTDILRIVE